MSESFPTVIALIGPLTLGLRVLRGVVLRAPEAAASVRSRVRCRRPRLGSASGTAQLGFAR